MNKSFQTMTSSVNQKWETPADLITKIKAVYPIDLDLCASRSNVCDRYYSEDRSCFDQPWDGSNMWANPEYNNFLKLFSQHFLSQYDSNRNYLFLVKSGTDTEWYRNLTTGYSTICTINGRLKFGSPEYWVSHWTAKRATAAQEFESTAHYINSLTTKTQAEKNIMTFEAKKKAYKGIPKTGHPPQPAPFASCLIYHGQHNGRLMNLFNELGQVWVKA